MSSERAKPATGQTGRAASKNDVPASNEHSISINTAVPAAQAAATQIILALYESGIARFLRGLASALLAAGPRV
jgi:hypothetical protein